MASISLAGVFTWSQYQSGSRAYQEYQQRTNSDQRKAADKIAQNCAVADIPVGIMAECLSDGIQAREKRTSANQDLKAQQDMAFWAMGVFVVSAISLPISVAGLAVILISLRHTRESIANDRTIGQAQTRAYLHCSSARYRLAKDRVAAMIEIENIGNSPANNVSIVGDVTIHDVTGHPSHFRVTRWVSSKESVSMCQPVVTNGKVLEGIDFFWDMDFVTNLDEDDDVEFKRDTFNTGNEIWFGLMIKYRDVFGKTSDVPLSLYAVIDAHPINPRKKRSRTGSLEIRIGDSSEHTKYAKTPEEN